ncbi:probable methyltransferase-like protein 24, partial [Centroberyx affinis]|uniref:probable methyltransferase-like protein 24 n=1 Tax=Centroberyx affinis TaxID=166261 RepID=UPI003A5BE6CB
MKHQPPWTRLTGGLLLRACFLLAAACVCVHVYLERGHGGAPAPLASGRPAQTGHKPQTRGKRVSSGPNDAAEQDGSVKRRVSYVRTLKKDKKGDGDGDREDPSPACCPPPRLHRKSPRWQIRLEPWASESRSLEDEARRFLGYITTPQVSCATLAGEDADQEEPKGPWAVCLDPKYSLTHRIHSKHCRVYSLGLGVDDRSLERSLASAGCEVHCFDPSLKQPHLQQAEMWLHRLSVDWRDPNPAIVAQRQHANTKKLATILNDFGHRQ